MDTGNEASATINGKTTTYRSKEAVVDDSFWADAFDAETGAKMKDSYDKGILDINSVFDQSEAIARSAAMTGRKAASDSLRGEYTMRSEAATAQANAYNTQDAAAANRVAEQANQAATAKTDLQKSITQDKQNLQRKLSAGSGSGGARKAQLQPEIGESGGRPI